MTDEDIISTAINLLETRLKKPTQFMNASDDTKKYLKLIFAGLEYESFRALFLNNQHGVIEAKELFKGTIDKSVVYPREVVKAALHFNAAAVIFSHNHPSGYCQPSQADIDITKKLKQVLQLIDVRVLDHVIVGGAETYSLAENGQI